MPKTKNKKPVKTVETIDQAINGENAQVILTTKQLTQLWAETSQYNNSNELFQVAMRMIDTFENKPFSASDFILASVYLDLSFETVTNFFSGWMAFLLKSKRAAMTEAENSCYDWPSFTFIK